MKKIKTPCSHRKFSKIFRHRCNCSLFAVDFHTFFSTILIEFAIFSSYVSFSPDNFPLFCQCGIWNLNVMRQVVEMESERNPIPFIGCEWLKTFCVWSFQTGCVIGEKQYIEVFDDKIESANGRFYFIYDFSFIWSPVALEFAWWLRKKWRKKPELNSNLFTHLNKITIWVLRVRTMLNALHFQMIGTIIGVPIIL